jgi:KDO2-lipid IV(A) lauroyltransferase
MRRSRAGVERNLARIAPPERRRALLWRTFYKYGLYLLDYMVFALAGRERTRALIAGIDGGEALARALEAGRGAILASPHLGNWELGGALLARVGRAPHVVTARSGDAPLERYRARFRRRLGIGRMGVGEPGGAPAGAIEAARVLRAGGIVAVLADRPGAAGRTVAAPFFGTRCHFPAGPAALALATGAPLFPVSIVLGRGFRYRVQVAAPIEVRAPAREDRDRAVRAATAALAEAFERWIRAAPDQWYNFYDWFAEGEERPGAAAGDPRLALEEAAA